MNIYFRKGRLVHPSDVMHICVSAEKSTTCEHFQHQDSTVWDQVKDKLIVGKLTACEQPTEHDCGEDKVTIQSEENKNNKERMRKKERKARGRYLLANGL